MRRKIQKYLSGEREGFSLIELIIVIAIMAILIGVVALVVLPYLESSRESTDRAALNEVATAFKSAASVNSKYATATEVNKMTTATASASLNADLKKKIESYLEKSLAETEKGLSSKNCTGKKFYFQKSDKGFKVYIGDASGAAKDSDEVEFSTTPASN